MMDYRVIGRNNGDSFFCIVIKETEDTIIVKFPMTIEKHTIPIGPTAIRETYSASQMCPFTDDRVFSFYKPELLYIKPLNQESIPFYVGMINRHESLETMKKYHIEELIDSERIMPSEDTQKRIEAITEFLSEHEEEEEIERPVSVRGNRTVH